MTLIKFLSINTASPLATIPLEVELIIFFSTIAAEFCKLIPAVIAANESSDEEFPKLAPKASIAFLAMLASWDLTAKAVVLLPSTTIMFS